MLLDKIFNDFENHFRDKLLSIADRTFDGIFSGRYKGASKTKNTGIGYKVPSKEECNKILAGCINLAENLFSVPSRSKPNVAYVVDMAIGQCECHVGKCNSVLLIKFQGSQKFKKIYTPIVKH